MTVAEIRQQFLDFFEKRGHKIVASAPIVVKDDPTLMFTNAGMNQFKDIFLGNKEPKATRVVDTQKCLRVSGKHNDLEEVGVDTYHHTMFEMLGNWSFGDYFKEDAINWAWELLTEVYKLDKDRLYVSVFEGDKSDGLGLDTEAKNLWLKHVSSSKIILGNKKDNFWEMGEVGPCGPCSEIHVDLRSDEERAKVDGASLVNADHEQVIEIWNLVFMQYNRKADGSLHPLPNQHVDTGMGFERLVRAVHSMQSNYDSDLFMNSIHELEKISGKEYGIDEQTDIAFRVIADHLRAVCFAIADGQLPDNGGAGYVIRRILRRAVRYGYSFLGLEKPFLTDLVPGFVSTFKEVFPGLEEQGPFVKKVVEQEEKSFLNTLNKGLKLFDEFSSKGKKDVSGKDAFELYDTFGFPIDLTQLLAKEKGIEVDLDGFKAALQQQKDRSRADAKKESGDWIIVTDDEKEEFVGYDYTETTVKITRYREVETKGKKQYNLVFNLTPFYAESGGQVGDKGVLIGNDDEEKIGINDTLKENQLIVHVADKLPRNLNQTFVAKVNAEKRTATTLNHSATHLLQAALREVLGDHVAQKGSLVNEKHLRFDFSHFQKVEKAEIEQIENKVNAKIREAVALEEARNVPFDEAVSKGAMALFGEKYGDTVRVITFDKDYSVELCGGTHVRNTAHIGSIKIVHEGAVAAGVRRIEAITGSKVDAHIKDKMNLLEELGTELGNPQDLVKALQSLQKENTAVKEKLAAFENEQLGSLKENLKAEAKEINGVTAIVDIISVNNAAQAKDLCFQFKEEIESLFCVLLADIDGKPSISIMISDNLIKDKGWNAGQLIREWAREVKGGGGGQPFFAQAGGADSSGLPKVKELATTFVNA
ncbi:MAG: alanine--tRNA ligase [Bacteroidia bacterium]|tara:strand:+ start:1067 stop:3688 length:2622 start_codon:yes stop_codon:yes gene_type:complete